MRFSENLTLKVHFFICIIKKYLNSFCMSYVLIVAYKQFILSAKLFVLQLVNKFDDLLFTKNDENFVEAFAIFCGMGIHNTHM